MDKKKRGIAKIMSFLTVIGLVVAIIADSFSAFDGLKSMFNRNRESASRKTALVVQNSEVQKNDLIMVCQGCNLLKRDVLECPIEIRNQRRYPNLSICAKGEWGSYIRLLNGLKVDAYRLVMDQSNSGNCIQRKIIPSSVLKLKIQFQVGSYNIKDFVSMNIGTSISDFTFNFNEQ